MKLPQWPWSTSADPLGAAWIWANLPSPRRKVSLQRQSSHISEDEREQARRREDRRRQSEQLESGEVAEAVAGILDRKRRVNVYLLVAGVISLISSVLLWTVNPYDIIFRMKATLSENGETFGIWKKPPVDLYLKVFLFNITNKDAFLRGKEKLRVEEVGPYVYKELMEHTDIVFNGNGTLTSIPRHPLVFVPEMTKGQLNDTILVPNIALMSMASVLEGSSYFTKVGFNIIVRQTNSEAIVKMTAEEFMFGYKDPLVGLGNTLLPSWIYFEKLGLIDRMYDFGDDTVTTYTGETDFRKAGLMERYNGLEHMPQWPSEPCNIVSDTHDGTKYPNFVSRNETLVLYRKSFCRGVPQEYIEDAVVDGMKAYHFRFKEGALNYSREENQCYCKEGRCLPSGLIDAESCYYGFPIALSYPHFYEGDPKLVEAVDGIKPIPEEHKSYFYMQVDVGLPLRMAARSQINMALRGMPGISKVDRFRNMVIPLLWTELSMDGLPPSLLLHFHFLLNILPVVQTVGIIVLFISGVLIIGLALYRKKPVNAISVEDDKDEQEEEEEKKTAEEEEEEKYHSLLMVDDAKTRRGSIHWPRRISIGPSA